MAPLIILFGLFCLPLIEIILFIEVGGIVGGAMTVFFTVVTSFLGLVLAKKQGFQHLIKTRHALDENYFSLQKILDGVGVFVAATLLLIPGFLTDAVGLCFLIPKARVIIASIVWGRLAEKISHQAASRHREYAADSESGPIIDGEFKNTENPSEKNLKS